MGITITVRGLSSRDLKAAPTSDMAGVRLAFAVHSAAFPGATGLSAHAASDAAAATAKVKCFITNACNQGVDRAALGRQEPSVSTRQIICRNCHKSEY